MHATINIINNIFIITISDGRFRTNDMSFESTTIANILSNIKLTTINILTDFFTFDNLCYQANQRNLQFDMFGLLL